MKVRVDVYSKDVEASLEAYKNALEEGACDLDLRSDHESDSKIFKHLNLTYDGDHSMKCINDLDSGPFVTDQNDM